MKVAVNNEAIAALWLEMRRHLDELIPMGSVDQRFETMVQFLFENLFHNFPPDVLECLAKPALGAGHHRLGLGVRKDFKIAFTHCALCMIGRHRLTPDKVGFAKNSLQ